jgi:Tfp pilus assembly protein PilF
MRAHRWFSWVASVVLLACGGGTAERRPSASAADARLAEQQRAEKPASGLVKQGESTLAANDAAAAKALFEQALAADGSDARAALDLGIADEMLGDVKGAEAAYRKALAIDAAFAEAENNLGVLLRERGELDEAVALLKRAVAASPKSASAHQNLALALEDQHQLEAAARQYAQALEIAPGDALTRSNYGLLLLRNNQKDAAVRELTRAQSDAQGNRAALLAIGNGLRRAGATDAALSAMQAAVSAGGEPATPALLSELALAQRAANKREEAVATLQKALAQDDSYATAHYLIANMLAADKRTAEAKQHYERYLKLEPNGPQADRARERLAVLKKH